MSGHRKETDSLGEVVIRDGAYWGAQTQRAIENFNIGSESMPAEVIRALAYVKKAAAAVNHEFGLLSGEKKNLIIRVCDEILDGKLDDQFCLKVWQTGSGTQTNMNVNEVIANRAHVLAGNILGKEKNSIHPNDDVNRSQSSNDVFPTAMNIAAVTIVKNHTLPSLTALKEGLEKKSESWQSIIKIGRTHLMDAVPLTLGQEFSGYVSMLDHGIADLEQSMHKLLELAIGGTAVGTGLNAPEGFDTRMAQVLSTLTGYDFSAAKNKFDALAAHSALVQCHSSLKNIAVSLMKIGNDIRMLGSGPRCGIGELVLPANEPGSSIMPGKVNPTQIEAVTMVCAQVMGNETTISIAGSSGHFELNVFKPVLIYNFLQSARLLSDAAASFHTHCVKGLLPNQGNIESHLKNSLMLVTSLTPHIGYDKAAEVAKKAYDDNISLEQACLELKIMTKKEFETYVDWEKMVRISQPEDE